MRPTPLIVPTPKSIRWLPKIAHAGWAVFEFHRKASSSLFLLFQSTGSPRRSCCKQRKRLHQPIFLFQGQPGVISLIQATCLQPESHLALRRPEQKLASLFVEIICLPEAVRMLDNPMAKWTTLIAIASSARFIPRVRLFAVCWRQ